MSLGFAEQFSLPERRAQYVRVVRQKPEHLPIIVEPGGTDGPMLDKRKFLVPRDLTGGQLLYVIRRRLSGMRAEQALFLFVQGSDRLVPCHACMSQIYQTHRSEDGFLYLRYAFENAFGGHDDLAPLRV